MIESDIYGGKLQLKEQRLCLDFANTANWHASAQPEEELNSYADLVGWGRQVGLLTAAEAERLLQTAAQQPADAHAALAQAVELREAIYRIFSAIAAGRTPAPADLAILNNWFATGLGRLQVTQTAGSFGWQWQGAAAALEGLLWPVAHSAAELLISAELDRVKECADERGCGWLFFDTSRNRSRRWCSMEGCGNLAKVRRHRRKQADAETHGHTQ
jgi:predicted RNA-binding Zn ribbon-like protein